MRLIFFFLDRRGKSNRHCPHAQIHCLSMHRHRRFSIALSVCIVRDKITVMLDVHLKMVQIHVVLFFLSPASSNQIRGGPRARQGLYLRGGIQTDSCQGRHRGGRQPAHGFLESANGPHQRDDRCFESG